LIHFCSGRLLRQGLFTRPEQFCGEGAQLAAFEVVECSLLVDVGLLRLHHPNR
jgi:hypothetical protein